MKPWEREYDTPAQQPAAMKPWEREYDVSSQDNAPKGFFEKQRERGAESANLDMAVDNGQYSKPVSQIHKLGQIGAGVNEAIGQGVSSAYNTLMTDEGKQRINADVQKLAQTKIGQMGIEALQKGGEIWNTYKQANPQTADLLESTANIGTAALGLGGIAKGAGVISEAAPNLKGIIPSSKIGNNVVQDIIKPSSEEVALSVSHPQAYKKVEEAIKKDFPDNWQDVLEQWKTSNEPLAKLGGSNVTTLAKGAAQYSKGLENTDKYFNQQIADAPERLKKAIADNISGVENYHATAEDLLKVGMAKASPSYKKAFATGKPITNDRINEFLSQPELQTGIQKGLKIQRLEAVAEGKTFNPKDYAITGFNEAGDPIIGQVPNMRLLDAGKRGLDAMIQEQTDSVTGKVTELGRALIKTKQSYVNELKKANPFYDKALKDSGDYFDINNAMRSGRDFMKTDSELIKKNFAKMSMAEKDAYKTGVGKQLRDIIDKGNEGVNPYNRVFGSNEQQKRLATILSPKEYINLSNSLKAENDLFKMRNEVRGGSPTTSKAIAAMEIAGGGAELFDTLTTGGIKSQGIGVIKGMIRRAFSGLNDKTADAVSKLIYEENPKNKLQMINEMTKGKKLSPEELNQVKQIYFEIDDRMKKESK